MDYVAKKLAEVKKNRPPIKHPWISDEPENSWNRSYRVPSIFYEQDWWFMEWAFGKDHYGTSALHRMNKWNELHWPLFVLKGDEDISESLERMRKFYKPEQRKPNWI